MRTAGPAVRTLLKASILPVVGAAAFVLVQDKLQPPRAPFAEYGVRLGMTPAEVRATFAPPAATDARWRLDASREIALEWSGSGRSFRFEFHGAQLMAIRAVLERKDPSTQGLALDVTNATVLHRHARGDGRVEVTLLARDCPSHAEEARRLISGR